MNAMTLDLLDTLKIIAANSDEENEWDAVEKLHENAVTANLAIARALITEGKDAQ